MAKKKDLQLASIIPAVIVREGGRSSRHRTRGEYWMPRLREA
jgi:hypothetical protein